MPKKLAGGKYAPSHTSVTDTALKPVRAAASLSCVTKISLGMITPIGNGPISMKCSDDGPTCLLVKVRGPRSIQELRVYTSDKQSVIAAMQDALA